MNSAFSNSIKVRFSDSDPNGHAFFASYLVLADEVANEYWAELGWDIGNVRDQSLIVSLVNCSTDFISECMPGDMLRVEVGFSRLGTTSLTLEFEIHNPRTEEMAARGSFTSVFVDKERRTSTKIPMEFRRAVLDRQPELA